MNSHKAKRNREGACFTEYSQVFGSVLTFIVGSIISIAIFFLVQSGEKSEIKSEFESCARNRLASLQTDIVRHQEVVNSIAGLFSSSQNVTRKEFHDFVNDILSRYPYIQGLSWNPLIKKQDQKVFAKKAHEEGFNNFKIIELNSNGQIIKAPVRDDYVAVYYIEPFLENKKALGFNIASNPERLKAIEQARDTGMAVITDRIKLVQEKKENFGYLLLKAIYQKGSEHDTVDKRREHFTGLAVGVFHFTDWIPLMLRETEPKGIDVWITNESAPVDKQLLHFHSSRTRNEVFQPTQDDYIKASNNMHWKTTIDILGRQWTFLFAPSPHYINEHKTWQASIYLVAGLIITILLTFYLFSKTRSAIKLATKNEELLNALNEIKTLQGIIPICSYCHSIRDDKGAWDRLESYLTKHSDASFSHGICPKCIEEVRLEAGLDKKTRI
jgi:CHASE1-domain containing sensor protein